jgi:hypothetical protein
MRFKIKEFLGNLEHYELVKLKQDLDKGNIDLSKAVKEHIFQLEKKHSKFCVTCSNDINQFNSNTFTILFGPEDFKKKASFCGMDCLQYFLSRISKVCRGEKIENKGSL